MHKLPEALHTFSDSSEITNMINGLSEITYRRNTHFIYPGLARLILQKGFNHQEVSYELLLHSHGLNTPPLRSQWLHLLSPRMEGVSTLHLQDPHSYQGTTVPTTTLAAWPKDPLITTVYRLRCIPSVTLSLPDADTAVLHLPHAGLSHTCWCLVVLAEGGTQLPTSPPLWFLSSGYGAPGCEAAPPSPAPVKVLPGLQLQGWSGDAPGPQAVLTRSLPQSPILPPADEHDLDLCQAGQWTTEGAAASQGPLHQADGHWGVFRHLCLLRVALP